MALFDRIRAKINRERIYLSRDVAYRLGLHKKFYRDARGSRILNYHGVCLKDHTRFNPIFLTSKTFEAHLKFYKQYFSVVSLDDYYQQKFSNEKFNICLTFDDGFANNYKYVLPLLEKYELPASFFVTAVREKGYDILWNDFLGIIGKYGPQVIDYDGEKYYKGLHNHYFSTVSGLSMTEKLNGCGFAEKAEMMQLLYPLAPFRDDPTLEDYWLQMTEDELRKLSKSRFVTIGAHGYYHNDLSRIDIQDAAEGIVNVKAYLEKIIEKPIHSFAFPYGAYNAPVVKAAKNAGFTQLLALDFYSQKDSQDPAMRERFTINPFISTSNQMYASVIRRYEY